MNDLAAGVLRTPGRPEDSFTDDPLRMLRAARFAAPARLRGGARRSSTAIRAMADRIAIVSAERVRDELVEAGQWRASARRARAAGRHRAGRPRAARAPALRLEIDEHHRHKDVYEHTLTVLEQAIALEDRIGCRRPDFVLRFAALLHDIGKPATRRFEAGGG